jgi:isopenicillin N synthase-like dioxygenase
MVSSAPPPVPVPVIDISGADGPDRARIAAEIDDACRRVGFLQLVGHGVEPRRIDAMQAACDEFFALPDAVKQRWKAPAPSINRGYAPLGTESLSYSLGKDAPPDLFEAFNVGPDDVDPALQADPDAAEFFPPNIWPDAPESFRAAVSDYFLAVRALTHRVTALFATALGLPDDFFASRTDRSIDVMRMINYERRGDHAAPLPGQLRMGAHTDYGIVTLLYADAVPGLEIVGPDGTWQPVTPLPGAYLANLGDLLAQWTNDRWRSTLHRVVPPQDPGPAKRRSAAFFHDGNHDARIECLPTCTSADDPPRYEPVRAADHLRAKVIAPRTRTATTALSAARGRLDAADR